MSLNEALDRVRKRLEELSSDIDNMRGTLRDIVKSSRPKPFKRIVEKRIQSLRPLERLKKREGELG